MGKQKHNVQKPTHRRFFLLHPHPLPQGNSNLASYYASRILAFKTPVHLGIFDDLPWGGYGFFLHINRNIIMSLDEQLVTSLGTN